MRRQKRKKIQNVDAYANVLAISTTKTGILIMKIKLPNILKKEVSKFFIETKYVCFMEPLMKQIKMDTKTSANMFLVGKMVLFILTLG